MKTKLVEMSQLSMTKLVEMSQLSLRKLVEISECQDVMELITLDSYLGNGNLREIFVFVKSEQISRHLFN